MRSQSVLVLAGVLACLAVTPASSRAQDIPIPNPPEPQPSPALSAMASLRVCLRLEDETPFLGSAAVRVQPEQGNELLGIPADGPGEFLFSGINSGNYDIFINSPGYLSLHLTTQIAGGPRLKSLFVPMKPVMTSLTETRSVELDPAPPSAASPPAKESLMPEAEPAPPPAVASLWNPRQLEEVVPPVDPSIACPEERVLRGAGERMSEFVQTLERFTAVEKLEHYPVDKQGNRKDPETRTFDYVVAVSQNSYGTFLLDEFRNGTTDAEQFPAHTATRGSPAMALIFHPALASGFQFRCEGMGQWAGREAWQVHFVQRPDHPVQIRSYSVNGRSFPIALEGRVWIDPGNNQVLHLESELAKPIPEIELTHERFAIDYQPVTFHSTGQQVWLPQAVDLYVERRKKRYYRHLLFSDFRLFNVDSAQKIQTPGESFTFTNTSDRDVAGELTISLREGLQGDPVVLHVVVPAHGQVFKLVGLGKDVNLPVTAVGAVTFVHEGDANAVKVDTRLVKGASLDIVPRTAVTQQP